MKGLLCSFSSSARSELLCAFVIIEPRLRRTVLVLTIPNLKHPERGALSLVRMKGLEPSRLATLAPKASVSTSSTTSARQSTLAM